MTDARADAVVVGAGHNGLVCAAYLARAGLRVVVCERRGVIGGATVTEQLAPGYRVSTASYSLSLLRPDIVGDLDLRIEIIPKDPQVFAPFPDGSHLFVWRDPERTRDELARIRAPDADAYPPWSRFWQDATARLRPLFEADDPPTLAEVERELPADVWRLAVAGSAADTVAAFFTSPRIQGLFSSQGIIGTRASVRDPGTAWVMTYHALGGELCGGDGTWAYVRGGMGSVADALADAAREAGAEIRVGAPVAEILVDADRAAGVRLEDGTVVRAPVVCSSADPVTTFEQLVGEGERVRRWRTPGSVVKVNLALTELPEFTVLPGEGPQHRGTITLAPSVDDLHDAFVASEGPDPSPTPFIEAFCQSTVDPTLAPPGHHVLSAFAQYAPRDIDPETWPDVRERAGRHVVGALAAHAPNIPDAIEAIDVLGPPELSERFGLTGGNIFHGEILPSQAFGERFPYRTSIDGLYLCGSGAPPGGAVTGVPGRNAARVVLATRSRTGG